MTYIFDFFGVISSELADHWFREYLPNYSVSELREKYVVDADAGRLSTEDYYRALAELSGKTPEAVDKEWRARAVVDQEVVSIIRRLKENNQIALCSNSPAGLLRPILKDNDLEALFEVIVISGEVGMVKPNHDIFNHTLKLLGKEASEVTFIDDNEKNTESAAALGMKTILFKSISDLAGLN